MKEDKNARLWWKLDPKTLAATKHVVGVNKISELGTKVIAPWLGFSPEKCKRFHSHFIRRTGATLMANSNLPLG